VSVRIYLSLIRYYYKDPNNSLSSANFVGSVVGFLSVCTIRLRRLLLAAVLSFEIEMVCLYN
jgi:hypothetical protein